ncbi:MAG: KEOPS complex subunit Pcc1 [Thermoproteota archaeon]|jgi:hypothetical protein
MNCKADIEIHFKSEKIAKNVFNSLVPDNVNIPKDLKLKIHVNEKKIYMEITSENVRRFQSTIEEILRQISVIEETMKEVNLE